MVGVEETIADVISVTGVVGAIDEGLPGFNTLTRSRIAPR
jgi:hypothetical protein